MDTPKYIEFNESENRKAIASAFGISEEMLNKEVKGATFENPMKKVTFNKLKKLYTASPITFIFEIVMRMRELDRFNRKNNV